MGEVVFTPFSDSCFSETKIIAIKFICINIKTEVSGCFIYLKSWCESYSIVQEGPILNTLGL